ncbi:hypothetical protein [Flexithrix dorotheae]|uniref:hypothetical protein n=1 Tax=Flexithrix dorotheae TaxID=70993 RepID=UPI000362F78A|nr:hypothetical protein [Flexithrix dorotheae]
MAKSKKVNTLLSGYKNTHKSTGNKTTFKSNFQNHASPEIVINEELQSFIPPLQDEEKLTLEQSIRKEGVREALLLWEHDNQRILVDGHNRYEIVKKLEKEGLTVEYGVKLLDLPSFEAVKDWMILNQLGRRNLTLEQRSYLRGLRYHREKQKKGGDRKSMGQNVPLGERVSETIAKEFNINEKTIRRDGEFAEGLEKIGLINPTLKREILAGRAKAKKASLQKLGKFEGELGVEFKSANDIESFIKAIEAPAQVEPVLKTSELEFQELKKNLLWAVKKIKFTAKDNDDLGQILTLVEEIRKVRG